MYDLMTATTLTEKDAPVICMFVRDEHKNRKIVKVTGFKPFFYAPAAVVDEKCIFDAKQRLVTKVFTKFPADVRHERKNFAFTDQADVKFELNYLVEANIYDGFRAEKDKLIPEEGLKIPLRVALFDIEVYSPIEIMPKVDNPIWPICTFTVFDTYTGKMVAFVIENEAKIDKMFFEGKEGYAPSGEVCFVRSLEELTDNWNKFNYFVFYAPDERHNLNNAANFMVFTGFDAAAGWWTNHYDWIYVFKRSEAIKFNCRRFSPVHQFSIRKHPTKKRTFFIHIGGMECVDLLEWYRELTRPEGQKLSSDLKFIVSEETYGKFQYTDYGDAIKPLHDSDHRTLIEYCFLDVIALKVVNGVRHLIQYYDSARRKVGTFLSGIHIRSNLIRPLLLRMTTTPLPTRPQLRKKLRHVPGAFVKQPRRGRYLSVATFDVRGMYPFIIVALNASPDAKSPQGTLIAANGVRFVKSPLGLYTRAVKLLIVEVEKLDEILINMQPGTPEYEILKTERETTKYTRNAVFGYSGYENSELYDPDVTAAITTTGVRVLKAMIVFLESIGYEVVYADTDSVHVQLHTSDWQEGLEIEQKLKVFLDSFCKQQGWAVSLDVKYENYFSRVLYHVKKRYVGFCTYRDKKPYNRLMIYGLAAKRSDSAVLTRDLQKEFFKHVIQNDEVQAGVNLIKNAIQNFRQYPLNMIGVPKGLQKELDEYEHFAWAEGVKWSTENLKLKFREDHKPLLVYGYVVGKPMTKKFCIRLEDDYTALSLGAKINYKKMIEVVIEKKFRPLLEACNVDWESVVSSTVPTKLEKWFA